LHEAPWTVTFATATTQAEQMSSEGHRGLQNKVGVVWFCGGIHQGSDSPDMPQSEWDAGIFNGGRDNIPCKLRLTDAGDVIHEGTSISETCSSDEGECGCTLVAVVTQCEIKWLYLIQWYSVHVD